MTKRLKQMASLVVTSILVGLLLVGLPVEAGEPDDFAGRADREAPIANEAINTVLNVLLEEALLDVNSTKTNCSTDVLKRRMFYAFDRNFPEFLSVIRHTAHKYIAGPREPEASALKPHTVEDILSKVSGLVSGGENLIPFWFNRNNGGVTKTKSGAIIRVQDPPPRQISTGPLIEATVEKEPTEWQPAWQIDVTAVEKKSGAPPAKDTEKRRTAK